MKTRGGKWIAILLAFCMVLAIFPIDAVAEPPTEGAQNNNTLTPDWIETGARNPDGTPVTSDQGDTVPSGEGGDTNGIDDTVGDSASQSAPSSTPDPQPAGFTLTVDLNGGQVNGMVAAGWVQDAVTTSRWSIPLTEAVAGDGYSISLDSTLGVLLPGAPYRAGYRFTGWDLTGERITIENDTVLTAQWQEDTYQVKFLANNVILWTVSVPYGATLWTASDAPWEDSSLSWENEQAAVTISLDGIDYSNVPVTRHSDSTGTYYTFRLNGRPYFTYGGQLPTMTNYDFRGWQQTNGSGSSVLADTAFTAQFEAVTTYVLNIYYYYESGSRVGSLETQSVTFYETQLSSDRTYTFTAEIPHVDFSTGALEQPLPSGITAGSVTGSGVSVTVSVDEAFAGNTSATKFLALRVIYAPAEISYKIEYHLQTVAGNDYVSAGKPVPGTALYGHLVSVPDRPLGADFSGFEISAASRPLINSGVTLETGSSAVTFEGNTATIHVYYDRVSYFIYFQTGTTEVQLKPLRLRFGETIPTLETYLNPLHRTGYQAVTREDVTWNRLTADGQLEEVPAEAQDGRMPAYDLYAVISWRPATTSIRIVYWVESRNSPSFQNAYTKVVENVASEERLSVSLQGNSPTVTGLNGVIDQGFTKLINAQYGDAAYKTFFSYSPKETKASPGNVTNAMATGTGQVKDGVITGNSFEVIVSGDGTTTINVYYTRNLYTLEFVLGRQNVNTNQLEISYNTLGSIGASKWYSVTGNLRFSSFSNEIVEHALSTPEQYGDVTVSTRYQVSTVWERDSRSPTGRLGSKVVNSYTYTVYLLTARFEADIASLWPTANNLGEAVIYIESAYNYISMGTANGSYYKAELGTSNPNILNAYSSMDRNIVATGNASSWNANADSGDGNNIAHQLIAYWYNSSSLYTYYFLYEALDTTLNSGSSEVVSFDADRADAGEYPDGQLVSYQGSVYVYRKTGEFISEQRSSNTKENQNQPAKQGFQSVGRVFAGAGDAKEDSNIYFFYTRERYTLDIQNVNGSYAIPEAFLTTPFSSLADYGENASTLRQLGWEKHPSEPEKVTLRYGADLSVLQEVELVQWLTMKGGLQYPLPTTGENQYYFNHWYRNSQQTIPIDWADNEVQHVQSSITLYAGWFSPRYTTTYVLNGGTWADKIDYTLMQATLEGQTVFLYYPHMGNDSTATLYWYVQEIPEDRLYVNTLYETQVGHVLEQDHASGHWKLKDDITHLSQLSRDQVYQQGSRLVDHYYCYMGGDGLDTTNNHLVYVNINTQVNTVLSEPTVPTRAGYTFAGWYYFAADDTPSQRVYLEDILLSDQGLASYEEDYVYLDHVGDAHLLYTDETGRLYYLTNEIGYRFSYSNAASVVTQTRQLYAAWRSTADVDAVVYHLVEAELAGEQTFTRKDGTAIALKQQISIGGKKYYLLQDEQMNELYTGSTVALHAWEYITSSGKKWLPVDAEIALELGNSTQTVAADGLDAVRGNTYRVADPDHPGQYTYYAFFIYTPTDAVPYRIYSIDLAAAVSMGALQSYHDTFNRHTPPDANAPYVLEMEERDWQSSDTTLVTENAPDFSGYVVYLNATQTLQLQAQPGTNNLYFYYVRDGDKVSYTIRYYLQQDGEYSDKHLVEFSQIPAVNGEILRLDQLEELFELLLRQAEQFSAYSESTDPEQLALYEQYRGMTITYYQEGVTQTYTVDAETADTLDLTTLMGKTDDYYLANHSPTGETLVLSSDVSVDIRLGMAQIVVEKVNTEGQPLSRAVFSLERLIPAEDGGILYQEGRYKVDETFLVLQLTSGADGRVVFENLSAWVSEDGSGYLYRLTELQAPAGYNRLSNPLFVTAPYTVEGAVSYTVTYTVTNTGISYLPSAGSGGIYLGMLVGGGLMATAAVAAVLLPRRRRRSGATHHPMDLF